MPPQPALVLPLIPTLPAADVTNFGGEALRADFNFWFDSAMPFPISFQLTTLPFSLIDYDRAWLEFQPNLTFMPPLPNPQPNPLPNYPEFTHELVNPFDFVPGTMRGWWTAGRHGWPFDLPLLFVTTPNLTHLPPLFGLGKFTDLFKWTFNGTQSGYSHGCVTLEDIR